MPPEIDELLAQMDTADGILEHVWQLSLVLETGSNPECASLAAANQELLPHHLRTVWLTVADQQEIAKRLRDMLLSTSNVAKGSLFSTLANCLPDVSFRPLIESIRDLSDSIEEGAASQAIFALYDLLCRDPEDLLILNNLRLVREAGTLEFLVRYENGRLPGMTSYSEVLERYRSALDRHA